VIAEAKSRGHEVTALARNPEPLQGEGVEVITGDIRDGRALGEVIDGAGVVISAVGARGRDRELHTVLAQNTIPVMTDKRVSRFVGISVGGLNVPGDRKGARDKLIGALARTLAGAATADRRRELEAWQASNLDWTLIRVPRLVDGDSATPAAISAHTPPRAITLHRTSLSRLLVEIATTDTFVGSAPFAADA
jgi:putative NADH-flavin reductase